MTDDLERLKARIIDAGLDAADAMNEALARIEALTAERDEYKRLALITDTVTRECKIQEARAEKAEADNDRAWAALWDILACETPNANATVTRMVAIAKAALKGESRD